MKKMAIVYHSGFGHAQRQAVPVAKGAEEAGAETKLIPVTGAASRFDELNGADAIKFGAPTCMARYLPHSRRSWRAQAGFGMPAPGRTNLQPGLPTRRHIAETSSTA